MNLPSNTRTPSPTCESLNKSCPTYVTSQFTSKLQPHIACSLVLQAHNVAQLEKIHRSRTTHQAFITSESPTPPQQDSSSTSTVSHEIPQHTALVSTSEQFVATIVLLGTKDPVGSVVTQHLAHDCP